MLPLIGGVDILVLLIPSNTHYTNAFVFNHAGSTRTSIAETRSRRIERKRTSPELWYRETPDTLLEIDESKIKEELESYGISTRSMFEGEKFDSVFTKERISTKEKPETSDFNTDTKIVSDTQDSSKSIQEKWSSKLKNVASVARKAIEKYMTVGSPSDSIDDSQPNQKDSDFAKPSPSSSSETRFGNEHRRERYKNALDEGRSMKISSLRQELKDRGISTGAFFDKMDLVEAYANVIADDIETNHSKRHNAGSRKDQSTTSSDPSYRDVTVHIFDPRAFTARDIIIDVTEGSK